MPITAAHALLAALLRAGYLPAGHPDPKNQLIRVTDDAAAVLDLFGAEPPTEEELAMLAALIAAGHLPSGPLGDHWGDRAAELIGLARFAARRATVPST